jgi:predicted nucleic acid-binding protein
MGDYLIDTNILVRLVRPQDPLNPAAAGAVDILKRRGEKTSVAAQNLIEFWSVATRPVEVNGLGMIPEGAKLEIERIEKMFRVLDETASVYKRWKDLVTSYSVRGRQVHDARLVALMLEHKIGNILTFNVDDFTRYSEVTAVGPQSLKSPEA